MKVLNYKLTKPNKYSKYQDRLAKQITQINHQIKLNDIPDGEQTFLVIRFLRKHTEDWIQPQIEKYLKNKKNLDELFADINKFKTKIKQIFRIFNKDAIAEKTIQKIK